jgi:hypothetical protein
MAVGIGSRWARYCLEDGDKSRAARAVFFYPERRRIAEMFMTRRNAMQIRLAKICPQAGQHVSKEETCKLMFFGEGRFG